MIGTGPDMKYTLFELKTERFHLRIGVRMAWLILALFCLMFASHPIISLPTFAVSRWAPMKLDITDDELRRLIEALKEYYANQPPKRRHDESTEMLRRRK